MSFFEAAGMIFSWWAVSLVMALAAWPVIFLCLRRLPDRGLAFARIFGLLLAGYFFWLGAWLRVWQNSASAGWFAILLVAAAGSILAFRRGENPWTWLRARWKEALFLEGLFLLLFAFWAYVRAHNPSADAAGGEKRMEVAFLNAILRSEYFPPNDPWLSGYAISYYHFGYILTGLLAKLTGVAGAVAHNLGSALWFGMAGAGSYGLLRNLLLLRTGTKEPLPAAPSAPGATRIARVPQYLLLPLLAPFALLWLGNLEGSLEVLAVRGVGWEDGQGDFWKWLDIKMLNYPQQPAETPDRFIWWWQASRVIYDCDLACQATRCIEEDQPAGCDPGVQPAENIDEFPAFSFLLGDLHPHVLALPFLLAGLAVILELLLRGGGAEPEPAGDRRMFLVFTALSLGSLVFLNTWDILLLVLAALAGWVGWKHSGRRLTFGSLCDGRAFLTRWTVTGILAILFFLPFFVGFASQAGGLLPNVLVPTRSQQYFVMFGVLIVPLAFWLLLELAEDDARPDWRTSILTVGSGFLLVVAGSLLFALIIVMLPALFPALQIPLDVNVMLAGLPPVDAVGRVLIQRLQNPLPWLVPILFITAALAILLGWIRPEERDPADEFAQPKTTAAGNAATILLLLLVAWGSFLVFAPEFIYVRDLFGSRMNTIFKFYFQTWIFWSLAAAYGVARLMETALGRLEGYRWSHSIGAMALSFLAFFFGSRTSRWVFTIAVLPVTIAGFLLGAVYLPLAIHTKTNGFDPYGGATLDSSADFMLTHPEDADAIRWMNTNIMDDGPVAEAIGGSYSEYGRVAAFTGIPAVQGWGWHEVQWRGSDELFRGREQDVGLLFSTTNWDIAAEILARYGIRYVYFGPMEAQQYGRQGLLKFQTNLKTIYQSDGVSIFEGAAP